MRMPRRNRRPRRSERPADASHQILPPIRACTICARVTRELDGMGRCKDRVICESRAAPLFRLP